MSYNPPPIFAPRGPLVFITTFSPEFLGPDIVSLVTAFGSNAIPTADLALYLPFGLSQPLLAQHLFWENGAVAGNTDIGIYDAGGTQLVSSTPTANSGANVPQSVNITDTWLLPSERYWLGIAATSTSQVYLSSVTVGRVHGLRQEAGLTSGTLPATATFASATTAYIPFVGIAGRSTPV